MKKTKNQEDKNEEQSKMIKNKENKQLGIKSAIDNFDKEPSQEIKNMLIKFNNQEKIINYKRLSFKRDRNWEFGFKNFKSLKEFFKEI